MSSNVTLLYSLAIADFIIITLQSMRNLFIFDKSKKKKIHYYKQNWVPKGTNFSYK